MSLKASVIQLQDAHALAANIKEQMDEKMKEAKKSKRLSKKFVDSSKVGNPSTDRMRCGETWEMSAAIM